MKKLIVCLIAYTLLTGCGDFSQRENSSSPETLSELKKLCDDKKYFKLKETYELKKHQLSWQHALYFRAIIDNTFNKGGESNKSIDELLEAGELTTFTDLMVKNLYERKLQNHINLFEYEEASRTNRFIQENYAALIDSAEMEDFKNTHKIWEALKDTPKQKIIKSNDFTVPLIKDQVGLMNIDVSFQDTTMKLVFDTGANFSVIQKSIANRLDMKIIETDFMVSTTTGSKVKSSLAIAENMDIGAVTFKNVVFLVFNDEDLSFPQIGYHITGIIGFPVIRAMEEIHITRDNQLFVPQKATVFPHSNLAVEELMPIVACIYKGDTLSFHFDTGATGTSLFPLFFRQYEKKISDRYKKQTFRAGGAGGVGTFQGFVIDKLDLEIAGSVATLDSVMLHIENIGDEENYFHGNLGQDFIKQFEEMIISFKHSSVLFK
ncbi:MAG: pepsin/retropepsin-like aspartic protease family protein [Prolixibacteraceae bacterium]